ncbi:MAG TPA: GMC family oxidoreductase [Segetibacter sp.]|nr:GMC family oxidoreductase [Segetibacter sp.]
MANNTYDAIVVGSGISGGWAAKELTEKGLKVLMLERGHHIEHVKDYADTNKPSWEYPHRGGRTQKMIDEYPVLKRDYPLAERNLSFWAVDKDNPYIEKKPFGWFRGYHTGGRSLMWGRQSYRLGDLDFEANAKEGIAIDWPIRYKDVAPWYDYAETFAGISGSKEGLPQLPDGKFLPPMDMNIVEQTVAARIKEHYKNKRTMIIGRTANLTKTIPGRPTPCQYRNICSNGCPYGGYFSTQSSTLPAANATGNLTLRTFSIVTELIYDKDTKKAKGVKVVDASTNEALEFYSKIVFLCASTFPSTAILMRSATDIWPDGLGSSSGELGHNVMDHHLKLGASGDMEGFEDKYYSGYRPNGIYVPRFRNLPGDEKRNYLRGFGYQGSGSRESWQRQVAELSIGADLKEALGQPGQWTMGIGGFGEMLPYHDNKISLSKDKKDKWNMPQIEFDVEFKENEKNMRKDIVNDAVEMLEAAGVKNVKGFDNGCEPGWGIHEMGTARMGRDPKTSVLNSNNQVWDCKNVFVTDGSFMTSASCVNPSLTYMAMTARAADFAVKELKKRNM